MELLDRNEITCFGAVPEQLQKSIPLSDIAEGDVKKIVCGNNHCLILLNNGQLYGFGGNEEGQLGLKVNNSNKYVAEFKQITFQVNNLNRFTIKDIAAGEDFSLILVRQDETDYIVKFSINKREKYMLNKNEFENVKIDPIPEGIEEIENVYAFGSRKLFVTNKPRIFIGGLDFHNFELEEYTEIKDFNLKINSLVLGMNHCIILADDGFLYGIGDNTYGELGRNKTNCSTFTKLNINFASKIKEISSGARHLLILLESGELFCLGDNSEGQGFTYSLRLDEPTLVDLETEEKIDHCFAGPTHNLIVLKNGNVMTWGDAFCGKLGNSEEYFSQPNPQVVLKLKQKQLYKVGLGFQISVIATGRN